MSQKKEGKDSRYNKKREPLFRIEINTSDSLEKAQKMRQMKIDLIAHSGSAKKGVEEIYQFAKENGFFEKKN